MIYEKINIVIETVKNDRVYGFTLTYGSPYSDAFSALDDLRNHLDALQKKQIENQAAQETPETTQNNP